MSNTNLELGPARPRLRDSCNISDKTHITEFYILESRIHDR